jgi:iron complex transport system substrate-binding protein
VNLRSTPLSSSVLLASALLVGVAGCRGDGPAVAAGESEQTGAAAADVAPPTAPQRIVCLGSAVTDVVVALGFGERIVGVDTLTGLPGSMQSLPAVGYHRNVAAEGVLSLAPDLIIAEAETGPEAAVAQLREAGVPLVVLPEGATFDDAFARVAAIGAALGADAEAAAERLQAEMRADIARLEAQVAAAGDHHPSVLFVYARGGGLLLVGGERTGPSFLIDAAGGRNAAVGIEEFANLTPEWMASHDPDVILVTTRGLQSVGGVEGLRGIPGAQTSRALAEGRVVAIEDVALLGFHHRVGEAALALAEALHGSAAAP